MTTIVTHNRFFHLDEIVAIALLKIFYLEKGSDCQIIRTRDEKTIQKYQNDENAFVIDVGFKYDQVMKNFDHHQKSLTETWSNGEQYSSCGLVWKWLKDNGFLTKQLTNNQIQKIESQFIKPVDLQDNGVKYFQEMNFVSASNRNHHSDKVIDGHFMRTLDIVKEFINNMLFLTENNDKDIFCKNYKVTKFTDFFASVILIRNYAFDKNFTEEKDLVDNTWKFITTDKHNEELIYMIDMEKQTFSINDIVVPFKGSLVKTIWTFYKDSNRLTQKMNDETISLMEKMFINHFSIGNTVKEMGYVFMFEKSNRGEKLILSALNNFFMNTFAAIRSEINANKQLSKYIKNSEKYDGIVLCDSNVKNAAMKISNTCKDKKIVIIPRDKKSWKVQIISKFSKELSMPKNWCGLKGKKLHDVSGETGLIFCHKTGFMCMFEGTKEDVLSFAGKLL